MSNPSVPSVPRVLPDPLSLPWSDDWARFGDATAMPATPFQPLSGLTLADSTAAVRPIAPRRPPAAAPARSRTTAQAQAVAPRAPQRTPPTPASATRPVTWAPAAAPGRAGARPSGPTIVRSRGGGRRFIRFVVIVGIIALVVYLRIHGNAQ